MLRSLRHRAAAAILVLGAGWTAGCGEEDPLLAPPPPGTLEQLTPRNGKPAPGPALANPDIKPVPAR